MAIAYPIRVYKSQGATLEFAVLDIPKNFQPGLTYVAVSRVKTRSP